MSRVIRLTQRQRDALFALDRLAVAAYHRNRQVGASHTEAMTIARDDMELRRILRNREARKERARRAA